MPETCWSSRRSSARGGTSCRSNRPQTASGRPSADLVLPQHGQHDAADLDLARADRLHLGVRRLEPEAAVLLAVEALERGVPLGQHGDDDLAIVRLLAV